jgi:hypothetical protein
MFACTILKNTSGDTADGSTTRFMPDGRGLVPCPKEGGTVPAIVHGGWQEARGATIGGVGGKQEGVGGRDVKGKPGNSYFVENIKEELDAPGEWFFDKTEGQYGTIYLIPPENSMQPPSADYELVATSHKRVVTVLGGTASGSTTTTPPSLVKHFSLVNVTIAHAAATFMDSHEVPSGGDWSIHRGGAMFVDGAVDIVVQGCTFDQVDGNGLFLSRHVRNCTVSDNSFLSIGATAIAVVGASARHRTNMAGNADYPAFNIITRNLVDTVGVWVKQSAAYFKSITRSNLLRSNIFMNGPRSGVNFNDGAMGGEVMENNLLLNFVRESNDHGMLVCERAMLCMGLVWAVI